MQDVIDTVIHSTLPVEYPHETAVQHEMLRSQAYADVSSQLLHNVSTVTATPVRVVDVAGQELGDYRVIQILNRVYSLPLVDLSLARNHLTDETAFRLAVTLPSLGYLQTLNLSDNNIGDVGVKILFAEHVLPKSIRHLDLSKNCFGTLSAYYIGRTYALVDDKQPRLESLFLGGSRFQGSSVDFIRVLVSFLSETSNTFLRQLGVPFMSFPHVGGVRALAACIACSNSISDVNVSNNPFYNADCRAFFRASVMRNPLMKNVFLGQCGLTPTDKALIISGMATGSKMSWLEQARLSILICRELCECAMARYMVEYKGMDNWKAQRPMEWMPSLPFLTEDYNPSDYPPLLVPPWLTDGSASLIPAILNEMVNDVNAAWTLMSYLETVFGECEAAELMHNGPPTAEEDPERYGAEFRPERIFTLSELRQKKERVVAVNLLLKDFKYLGSGQNKETMELLCMAMEDLLSTLLHHESSLRNKIVEMYAQQLGRRFNCVLHLQSNGARMNLEGVPDAVLKHIPFYRYLGDAALYIHLIYFARPFEVFERRRSEEAAAEEEKLRGGRGRNRFGKSSHRRGQGANDLPSLPTDDARPNPRMSMQQRVVHRFIPNDRGLFVKLTILRLEPSEGERALFAGSRANQRFATNELELVMPDVPNVRTVLEVETDRCQLKHLANQNVNAAERAVSARYMADEMSESRLTSRMEDLAC